MREPLIMSDPVGEIADNDNDAVAAGPCDECGGAAFLELGGRVDCVHCGAELLL